MQAAAEQVGTHARGARAPTSEEPAGPVYLNNAATAWPRAPGVADAVADALSTVPAHPGRAGGRATDVLTECRCRLAGLLEVEDPTRIILTVNATHALNLAIGGLAMGRGAHVVTTVTEHNSVLRPIHHLRKRRGLRVTVVKLGADGGLDAEAFERALGEEPALVAVNHASNVTGRVNDVGTLFEKAKSAGAITLLDASQSLGHVPVAPTALQADLVAFTGHKGLLGPPGTGGLYVAPGIELGQVLVGGTGVRSDLEMHPPEMPTRLEAGTPNVPALAGLAAALRWLELNGESHGQRESYLADRLRRALQELPGVTVFDRSGGVSRIGVVSFRLAGWDVEDVGVALEESFGVVCRTGLHCAPLIHEAIGSAPAGTVRFSVSGFNTERDLDVGIGAVEQMSTCALSR